MPALDIGEQDPAPEEMFGNDTSKFPGLPGMSTDSTGEQVFLTGKKMFCTIQPRQKLERGDLIVLVIILLVFRL